ncbi:MAG: DUF4332 domain-containing protein, partial [Verrucomicrobiales bacterium]
MAKAPLTEIDGIGDKAVRLFAHLKIRSVADLAGERTGDVYARLYELNREQEVYSRLPPIDVIEEWVTAARILTGIRPSSREDETGKQPSSPSETGAEEIADVSPQQWIELYDESEEAVILRKAPEKANPSKTEHQSSGARLAKHGRLEAHPGAAGAAKPEKPAARRNRPRIQPVGSTLDEDRKKEPGLKANEVARRVRRGITHPQPSTIYLGAVIALTTRLLVFLMVVGTPLMLFFLPQYVLYFAVVPALLIVCTIFYAFYASRVRCRVCSGPLLIAQKCLKHENAHHLFGFGYVGSMSLHALIFAWFRCIYC